MSGTAESDAGPGPTLMQRLLRLLGQSPIPKVEAALWRLGVLSASSQRHFVVPFAGLMYNGRLDQFVDRNIYYFGAYAPEELAFLNCASAVIRAERGGVTFVDVGANVGQHSLFMASRADRVVAFEPNDEVADRLAENLRLNRIGNVDLYRFALGREHQTGMLGSGLGNNSGSRSLIWSLDQSKDISVSIRNADEGIAASGIGRVDLLKIDVEGFEKNVLEGMSDTLCRDRPVILFELIGTDTKGGFHSEAELRRTLYADHCLFTFVADPTERLSVFNWTGEEAVCLPRELVGAFSAVMDVEVQ